MTRINCVPVEELSGPHLVAEYREIARVYALAGAAYRRGESPSQHGQRHTLGPGHVRFFYSRLGYVVARHKALIKEMQRRGYRPNYTSVDRPDLPLSWFRRWEPDAEAIAINRARIEERSR